MFKIYRQLDNPLLTEFTSDANIQRIQKELVRQVYHTTGYKISYQSELDLMGIMNAVYQTHGNTACANQTAETLNALVLEQALENVLGGIRSYLLYVRDASTLPTPLPRSVSTTEDKSLELGPLI
jgi:hypothetical protein